VVVGINWGVPFFREFFQASDMIEMAVGHYDRGGPGPFAEAFLRRAFDATGQSCHARIDQDPLAISTMRRAKEGDVYQSQAAIREIRRDLPCSVVGVWEIRD
jgi:hypothetical protein